MKCVLVCVLVGGGARLQHRESDPLMCYMCKFTALVLEINAPPPPFFLSNGIFQRMFSE